MSVGPYTFLGPLWWQGEHFLPLFKIDSITRPTLPHSTSLRFHGLLGQPYVFSDLPTTATHDGHLPDFANPMVRIFGYFCF